MREEIFNTVEAFKKGKVVLYPTDTIWGIGCDATNANAVDAVFQLKKRQDNKALICLVSDFKMLNQFVENIPEVAYDILKYAIKPTTIIYDNPIRIAENIVNKDNTLAIRVVKDDFCKAVIRKLRRPIVSTSANISEQHAPKNFKEISKEILDGVDYIVNLRQHAKSIKPSAIIKITTDGTVQIIRK